MSQKLSEFLREVSNWQWDAFVRAEKDPKFTSNQAVVFSLIRACALQKMDAIKISIGRLDGKLKTPVKVEMPKVFFLFPNAKPIAESSPSGGLSLPNAEANFEPRSYQETAVQIVGSEVIPPDDPAEITEEDVDLDAMGFRDVIKLMGDYPREVPEMIVAYALQTEQWLREQSPRPPEIPRVKSVVAAHLIILAQRRNIDALYEIFDQIDGKLVETLQVLGEDIFITSYSSVAPDGAYLNKDGVMEIEATEAQNTWANKLDKLKGSK